jgi:subtilisin-like proprotein convertase family protein
MRKIFLFLIPLLFFFLLSNAQTNNVEKNAALQIVGVNKTIIGLTDDDLNNLDVSNSYVDKTIGVRYVYLQQTYKSIPVYNQIQVLAFKNNQLMSNAGGRIAEFDKKVNVISGMPSVTASNAVMAALADKKIITAQIASAVSTKDNGRKVEFGKLGVSRENITAQLMWFPDDKGFVSLGWQVYFIPVTTSDYWLSKVDASNGTILGADNLTAYCSWDDPNHQHVFGENHKHTNSGGDNLFDFSKVTKIDTHNKTNSPSLADNASYRVVPYPFEAPTFMPGAFPGTAPGNSTVVNNPWTSVPAAFANATTLKWHSTATTGADFNYTRGNNVWAYQDPSTVTGTGTPNEAASATSTTPLPTLNFAFGNAPDYTLDPQTNNDNQKFNVTNLFYYNNILHDILYTHGFDEAAGNFQQNNLSRNPGGATVNAQNGSDYVFGDAQDGSGSNNANFATPPDGSSGRMQMYLWTTATPRRDGDVDNGIIAHELGHGVSNRLFGGPANVSCVQNGEHQGEGISDYIGLMVTQDWSVATVNTGLLGRGIGTFALNQPTTGVGIRSQRYSTDFAINNKKYQAVLPQTGSPHARGEHWCAAAWEATWAIIQQSGTIHPNIYYNGTSTAGNIVAMRIAMQAMKLAPCGSGYIDHRDAWLRADTLLYGGTYSCSIWEAFRKRGMGYFASQGSANSDADQIPDETAFTKVKLTASAATIPAGQNLTYTNAVSTCSRVALVNYLLIDTLPVNASFVSATAGGAYNAANRVVSWVVNQAANSTVNYQFTVTADPAGFPGNIVMRSSLFDNNTPSVRRFNVFQVTTPLTPILAGCPSVSLQPANAQVCVNTTATFSVTANASSTIAYLWQVSTDGGTTWTPLTNTAPYSGVNTTVLTVNPTDISLNNYRYRCFMTTVDCTGGINSNPAALSVVTGPAGGTLTPATAQVCGTTNSGTIRLTGRTGAVVRWESSINGGTTWANIANTTDSLVFTNITATTQYRAFVQVAGCAGVYSTVTTITFIAVSPLTIVADPGTTLCAGDPALLTVVGVTASTFTSTGAVTIPSSGAATPYPSNLVVTGLPATGVFVKSVTLSGMNHTFPSDIDIILQSPTGVNTVLMSDVSGTNDLVNNTFTFDDAATALMTTGINASGAYKPTNLGATDAWFAPLPASITQATPTLASFTGNPNGTWKLFVVDDLGGDFGDISGGFSITFNATGVVPGLTYNWSPSTGLNQTTGNPVGASPLTTTTYTVLADNGAGCVRQAAIILNVNQRPAVTARPVDTRVCAGSPATFTITATGTNIVYQWQVSTDLGVTYTNLVNSTPYSGVNTATLTISPTAASMNTYRYRCAVSGLCPPVANSTSAILTVVALPVVKVTPDTSCGGLKGVNGTLLTATGADTYIWSPITGLYTNALATIDYTAGTQTPTVYAAPTSLTYYTVTGISTATGCTATAIALVNYTPPAPTVTPAAVVKCLPDLPVKLMSSSSSTSKVSFLSGAINVAIPEGSFPNPPATAGVSTIPVSGVPSNGLISNISVKLNITHPFVGDVVAVLKAPNGAVFSLDALLNKTNNSGADFVNTVISSTGTTTLNLGTAPFTGTFKADAVGATFVAFGATLAGGPVGYAPTVTTWNGLYSVANGNWTLAMYDAGAPDLGSLTSWSIDIEYVVGVPTNPAIWTPATGLYTDAAGTIQYTGTPIDSIYASPAATTTYTATVTGIGPSVIQTFANTAPVTINALGVAAPYPSNLAVSGLPTTGVTVKSVTLSGTSHTFPADVDIILQSPTGQNVVLMSDVGGGTAIVGQTYTFTDGSAAMTTGLNPSGIYSPTNIDVTTDNWPAPGPGAFAQASPALASFTGNPNGGWKLFIVDDLGGDGGSISGGYSITFSYPTIGCLSPGKTVTVTVNNPVVIKTQPVNKVVCTDKSTSFTTELLSGTAPSHNWQVSTTNGNSWQNIINDAVYGGAKTATLTLTAPPVSMSGNLFRDSIKGAAPCGFVFSANAGLTVNPLPVITLDAAPRKILPGVRARLFATVTPAAATYTWLRNGVQVPGNTNSLSVDVDGLGNYTLRVQDVNGCVGTSNMVTIADSASGRVFVYPNPTGGQFQVRYYSSINDIKPKGINIFDSRGKRLITQTYPITAPYSRMDVDLSNYSTGVYTVEVVDVNGNRLAIGRVSVIR